MSLDKLMFVSNVRIQLPRNAQSHRINVNTRVFFAFSFVCANYFKGIFRNILIFTLNAESIQFFDAFGYKCIILFIAMAQILNCIKQIHRQKNHNSVCAKFFQHSHFMYYIFFCICTLSCSLQMYDEKEIMDVHIKFIVIDFI